MLYELLFEFLTAEPLFDDPLVADDPLFDDPLFDDPLVTDEPLLEDPLLYESLVDVALRLYESLELDELL